jgi:iron complex outermembrane receptor protein
VTYAVSDDFTCAAACATRRQEGLPHRRCTPTSPRSVRSRSISESKNKVNWDLSGTYKLNRDVNLYARVATGFRAPSIAAASASVPITVADAETITSYEGRHQGRPVRAPRPRNFSCTTTT